MCENFQKEVIVCSSMPFFKLKCLSLSGPLNSKTNLELLAVSGARVTQQLNSQTIKQTLLKKYFQANLLTFALTFSLCFF